MHRREKRLIYRCRDMPVCRTRSGGDVLAAALERGTGTTTLSEQSARRICPRLFRCSSRLHSVYAGSLLQVVGTHNSYHQAPPEEIQNLAWNPLVDAVAASYAQSAVNTTQYSHLNFYEQLELGKHLICCLHLHACLPQQLIR